MPRNPIVAYCLAVREFVGAEHANLEARSYRPGSGPKDTAIERRADRLQQRQLAIDNLRRLADVALRAACDAGYAPETVERRLHRSLKAADELTKWEKGLLPIRPDSDDRAEAQFVELAEHVERALEPVENMAAAVRPAVPATKEKKAKSKSAEPCRHAPDYRSVRWYGRSYSFTANQAACIKVLWEAWEKGVPEVGDHAVLERAGIVSDRLDLVFRNQRAWGTMILPGRTRGTHRLVQPKK
jgi:hypothetical protein